MSKARDIARAGTALANVDATELGYLDGVTSSVQTQLDAKAIPANVVNNSLVDAKGDLLTATADNTPARLAVGANDTVLTADSTAATGLKWAAVPSGGMTLLSTTSLTGNAVTISSISQAYTSLLVMINGATIDANQDILIRPNDSSGSYFTGKYANTNENINNDVIRPLFAQTPLNTFPQTYSLYFPNYSNTSYKKPFFFYGIYQNSSSVILPSFGGGAFNSNSAISSIKFTLNASANFTGGQILIYGVK